MSFEQKKTDLFKRMSEQPELHHTGEQLARFMSCSVTQVKRYVAALKKEGLIAAKTERFYWIGSQEACVMPHRPLNDDSSRLVSTRNDAYESRLLLLESQVKSILENKAIDLSTEISAPLIPVVELPDVDEDVCLTALEIDALFAALKPQYIEEEPPIAVPEKEEPMISHASDNEEDCFLAELQRDRDTRIGTPSGPLLQDMTDDEFSVYIADSIDDEWTEDEKTYYISDAQTKRSRPIEVKKVNPSTPMPATIGEDSSDLLEGIVPITRKQLLTLYIQGEDTPFYSNMFSLDEDGEPTGFGMTEGDIEDQISKDITCIKMAIKYRGYGAYGDNIEENLKYVNDERKSRARALNSARCKARNEQAEEKSFAIARGDTIAARKLAVRIVEPGQYPMSDRESQVVEKLRKFMPENEVDLIVTKPGPDMTEDEREINSKQLSILDMDEITVFTHMKANMDTFRKHGFLRANGYTPKPKYDAAQVAMDIIRKVRVQEAKEEGRDFRWEDGDLD